ncbi:hypothetical protein BH11PSE9_BH11PSE9_15200 [soil metagenome]
MEQIHLNDRLVINVLLFGKFSAWDAYECD